MPSFSSPPPDADSLRILAVLAASFVIAWLVTPSIAHAILLWGGGMAFVQILLLVYILIVAPKRSEGG